MKNVFFVFIFSALLGNSYYVGQFVNGDDLNGFSPVLIAVCITTAIFAINFSFYQYQASPYKEITRQLSPVHIRLSLTIFALSLLPLLSLSIVPEYTVVLALSLIPTIGVVGFFLLLIARNEVDILTVINRKTTERKTNIYLKAFAERIDSKLLEIESVNLSDIGDTPMHEWEWTVPPSQPSDSPATFIESANSLIVKNRDINAFSELLDRAFDLVDTIYKYKPEKTRSDAYKVTRVLNGEASSFIKRICVDAISGDNSCSFSRVIANQTSNRLIRLSSTFSQTSDYSFLLLSLLSMVGERCYENEHFEIAVDVVSLSRKIVNKGLEKTSAEGDKDVEFSQYEHLLPQLTYPIMELGSHAIKKGSSEILYRCLDAYGWLGCASIKRRNYGVTLRCLRSLAQLGREARSANLECFWGRCSITPWGHAEERIGWIYSWVIKIDVAEREHWLSAIKEAYQRLSGHQVELGIDESGEKSEIKVLKRDGKHTMTYYDHGHERTIDYSDFSFLKDMEMY